MPSQGVVLEASQSLLEVLQSLRAVNRIPVRAIPPRTGKIQRALSWTALAESGRIYWKRGAEWLPYTLDEILSFPLGKHDDIVDALSLGFSSLWDALPVKALGVPRQSSLVTASQLQAAQRARRWA